MATSPPWVGGLSHGSAGDVTVIGLPTGARHPCPFGPYARETKDRSPASRSPAARGAEPRAPWGGYGVAGGPLLTRLAAPGAFAAGLVQQHARVEARFKGKFPMFAAEGVIWPGQAR
jgi:hypothetical protein